MKGLLLGGLGGLLMGSLFANMGSSWFCISIYGKYVGNRNSQFVHLNTSKINARKRKMK